MLLLVIFSGCNSAEKSERMTFYVRLPSSNARALYYDQNDATSYSVSLTKGEIEVSKKENIEPGRTLALSVEEEGTYTITVIAYKDNKEIARGSSDFDIDYAIGDVRVSVALNPNVKSINITVDVDWVMPEDAYIAPPSGKYTELPKGTDGTAGIMGNYVTFGLWPQSEKADDVTVYEVQVKNYGAFTYYKGSDDALYAKQGEKYYKVEPIKWRVLTTDFDHDANASTPGKKLLLAENILIKGCYYNYGVNRSISNATVYPNNYEYSSVRAFLNGLNYTVKESANSSNLNLDSFLNKGFLQTAFSDDEMAQIAVTSVQNNVTSTLPSENYTSVLWNNGKNPYAVNKVTKDKVFLLSIQEATRNDLGFASSVEYGAGNTRCRKTTDFSKVKATMFSSNSDAVEPYGDYWWLRSPSHFDEGGVNYVESEGELRCVRGMWQSQVGIVPALCIE